MLPPSLLDSCLRRYDDCSVIPLVPYCLPYYGLCVGTRSYNNPNIVLMRFFLLVIE